MNAKDKSELAQWVMEQACRSGADDAAVNVSNRKRSVVEFRDGQIERLEQTTQHSLRLSIYKNNRFSSHSTNDLRKSFLKEFVEKGIAVTGYLEEDKYRTLPDPKYYPKPSGEKIDLKIRDSGYENFKTAGKIEIASEIESAASEESDRIISVTAHFSDTRHEIVKLHSNGFSGESSGTAFSASATATVKGADGDRPEGWYSAASRFGNDLPPAGTIGKEAAGRALRKIGQKKIDSGKYDMIVENSAGAKLVASLLGPMSARALQQKNSFLEGMLGKKIASEKLSVTDQPFVEKGFGSRFFDGEGLAASPRPMIEKGILRNYYVDTYYGKKLGMGPTSGSISNLLFDTGTRSLEEAIADLKQGILVTGFIGGSMNPTTGDFSLGISGIFIENGEFVNPVNEMNIAGNALELWDRLIETCNDPYPYASLRAPSMRFEKVDFSGI